MLSDKGIITPQLIRYTDYTHTLSVFWNVKDFEIGVGTMDIQS